MKRTMVLSAFSLLLVLSPSALFGQTVQEGRALQEKLAKGHPMMKPGVGGEMIRYVVASVPVPLSAWKRLKPTEQLSLGMFARSTSPYVRANPDSYLRDIGIPQSAPVYSTLRSNIAQVCDDCFEIMLVTVEDSRTVSLERVALRGDTAWARDPRASGEKWSDFEKRLRATMAAQTKKK